MVYFGLTAKIRLGMMSRWNFLLTSNASYRTYV